MKDCHGFESQTETEGGFPRFQETLDTPGQGIIGDRITIEGYGPLVGVRETSWKKITYRGDGIR